MLPFGAPVINHLLLISCYFTSVGFIVDSSPSKQYNYAPSLGIPILSPCDLSRKKPQILIINASSYNNEVLDIALRDYPEIPSIFSIDNGSLISHR